MTSWIGDRHIGSGSRPQGHAVTEPRNDSAVNLGAAREIRQSAFKPIFEADDCSTPLLSCLACGETAEADYGFAMPIRMYRLALSCGECGQQFCDWEL